jgi:hypothetical protein
MFCISSYFFVGKQICFICRPHGFDVFGQQTIGIMKDNKMVVILGVWIRNSL